MPHAIFKLYEKVVLNHPVIALLMVLILTVLAGNYVSDFRVEASADSLVLENDTALDYYRAINKKYGTADFLVITYTPHSDLLSEDSLEGIEALVMALSALDHVSSVVSILDVPLLHDPELDLADITTGIRSLRDPHVDRELARKEFHENPLYSNMLVSRDGRTTAIQVNFKRDETYYQLLEDRDHLRKIKLERSLTPLEQQQLDEATIKFKNYTSEAQTTLDQYIERIRTILDKQRHRAEIFLGGVPMIASDMVSFIKHDIFVFGISVFLFIILALSVFFRSAKWVLLPIGCCAMTLVLMVGWLGWVDWRATVISSNFMSLLLIIVMSLCVHLIVRYQDLQSENPSLPSNELVRSTLAHMVQPCFYTAITTIVAFCSLLVSGIRPVIDFGWMMTLGIVIGFLVVFIVFPSILLLWKRTGKPVSGNDTTRTFTLKIANFTITYRKLVCSLAILVLLFSVTGISQLRVENRFIDYFKESTEIYQGMEVIDQQLGGTTPLDVILDADPEFMAYLEELKTLQGNDDFDDDFSDDFNDDFEDDFEDFGDDTSNVSEDPNFWFNGKQLNQLEKIHDHIESLPVVGKVQSVATAAKVVKSLNDDKLPNDIELAVMRSLIPEEISKAVIYPYMSEDANQVRINMRVLESDPSLRRAELIETINNYLINEMGFQPQQVSFTGMVVLYNNMLQSLFKSQILTIGMVFLAIMLMLMVLFRAFLLAVLAIIPNILSAGMVLGIMGWFKVPLDMMTITIAAIVIGIAVDHSIHYIYRFREEFAKTGDYSETVRRCHGSIGKAMYYTAITIVVGFSILALSNFIPSIYFGLLTAFAMLAALACNLTLLPLLIMTAQPLGHRTTAHPLEPIT
jgi:predicted RND superfamily exporter protein